MSQTNRTEIAGAVESSESGLNKKEAGNVDFAGGGQSEIMSVRMLL